MCGHRAKILAAAGRKIVDDSDGMAVGQKTLDQMGAYESCAAGDDNVTGVGKLWARVQGKLWPGKWCPPKPGTTSPLLRGGEGEDTVYLRFKLFWSRIIG